MPSQFYYIRVYLSNSVVHHYKEISTMDPVSSLLHRRNIRIQHGLRLSHYQPASSGILDILHHTDHEYRRAVRAVGRIDCKPAQLRSGGISFRRFISAVPVLPASVISPRIAAWPVPCSELITFFSAVSIVSAISGVQAPFSHTSDAGSFLYVMYGFMTSPRLGNMV